MDCIDTNMGRVGTSSHSKPGVHSVQSEEDLKKLFRIRQASMPDDILAFAEEVGFSRRLGNEQDYRLYDSNATYAPIVKRSRSMFNLTNSDERAEALSRFYNFARRLDSYETGVKEKELSFYSPALGGEFHFIQFETRHMKPAIDLIRINSLHLNIVHMGATGGGAQMPPHQGEEEEIDGPRKFASRMRRPPNDTCTSIGALVFSCRHLKILPYMAYLGARGGNGAFDVQLATCMQHGDGQ